MELKNIRMGLLKNAGPCKAICSFSLDGMFVVKGVRILETKNGGHFIAFPSRVKKDGKREDLAFPTNKEFYQEVQKTLLKKFDELSAAAR